jgi:hypothetical protein
MRAAAFVAGLWGLLGSAASHAALAAGDAPAPEAAPPVEAAPPAEAAPVEAAPVVEAAPEGSIGPTRPRLETTVNGYLDARFIGQRVKSDAPLSPDDTPRFANLTEANFQLKLRWGDKGLALADASFFYQRAAAYLGPDHDVAAYHSLAVISELYASYWLASHVNVTIGKKRVVWGPGFVINPMDLLNPPKDPTDPSLQRAGAWLARLELPYDKVTLSFVGAAQVLNEYGGVPADLLYYPSWQRTPPGGDGEAHFAAAARLYALVADTDINLEYAFTNLYNDAFRDKSRIGLSASRIVFKALEVHVEALGQLGSARAYVDPACVTDLAAAMACGPTRVAPMARLASGVPVVKGVAGARYTFDDESMLGADYALYSDGFDDGQWRAFLRGLALARGSGLPVASVLGRPAGPGGGTPQKFAFQPLRRQYLFVTYSKPRIRDDFTLNLTLITSLQDLSAQVAPQLAWQIEEWVTCTVQAFIPLPTLDPTDVDGTKYGELALAPSDWRALASVRVFY